VSNTECPIINAQKSVIALGSKEMALGTCPFCKLNRWIARAFHQYRGKLGVIIS